MPRPHASLTCFSHFRPSLRFSLRTLMMAVTACCFAAWYYQYRRDMRWAEEWVQPLASNPTPRDLRALVLPPVPKGLPPERELEILQLAATRLPSSREKLCALKILVERKGPAVRGILRKLIEQTDDPELRCGLLQVLCLPRDSESVELALRGLDDPAPQVRAAAAAALGYIHNPRTTHVMGGYYPAVFLPLDPPIDVAAWRPKDFEHRPAPPMAGARERLEAMLLERANLLERRAAMQALAFWPPGNLKLRVVELEVCRIQTETILRSHGIGKTYFLLEDEDLPAEPCWTDQKHQSLVCRVTSRITTNRPAVLRWNLGHYRAMHAPSLVPLAETRLLDSPTDCILVTPAPPASAVLLPSAQPHVPARDRLRESTASWISNGEFCERFGHYSRRNWRMREPVSAYLTRQDCFLTTQEMTLPGPTGCCPAGPRIPTPYDDPPIPATPKTRRTALIVEVDEGRIVGWETSLPDAAGQTVRINLSLAPDFLGQNVQRRLEMILQELGLTEVETRDLLVPWRASFFGTHGLRLLTVMSRADFETASSFACMPYPDELVRVGIIVKEL